MEKKSIEKFHSYYAPLYILKYKKNLKRIFISRLKTINISKILFLSNSTYLTTSYDTINQYKNLNLNDKIITIHETNDITNIIEIENENKNKNEILIAYSISNILKIYSLKEKKIISLFDDHEWAITSILEYSLNKILTSSNDKTIKLFNIKEQFCIMNILAHSWSINKIIKLKNNYISSCSWDKSIKVWELNEGFLISELIGHFENVNDIIEFKENLIISVSEDLSIRFWDWKNEKCIFIIENACFDSILKIVYLNKNVFITYSDDGFVKFWDFENKKIIQIFDCDGFYIKYICNIKNSVFAIWINGIFVFSNERNLNLL